MMTILIFAIVLGVLVFVHELGHFLVAIRNGIKADEFGFGFPPRIAGFWKDEAAGKYRFVFGSKNIKSKNTIYSINWIPLGGFVKIKGEGGEARTASDSFASKGAWIRVKVLAAGVIMNFVLGWFLFSILFFVGMPEAITDDDVVSNSKVQITEVMKESSAEKMGIQVGDELVGGCELISKECRVFSLVSQVQEFTSKNKGQEVAFRIRRGENIENVRGVLNDHKESAPLGVSLARTAVKNYSIIESIWQGLLAVLMLGFLVVKAFFLLLKGLFVESQSGMADVSGPVGIAVLVKQVSEMGFVYLVRLTAVLSVNLGIINALPIPALDGGRIIFILMEKIKGSPVSQKFENASHTIGFFLLILLMIFVTFSDFVKFDVFGKIIGLF